MSFLTPFGAFVTLLVVVPIVAFLVAERGRSRVAALLRFVEPSRGARLAPAVAVAIVAASFGLAATQPTLVTRSHQRIRTDAEAWFVLDTSLSMKASAGVGSPTRFERAQALAIRLRNELKDIPVGIASITDRALPHLFPTPDSDTFDVTVHKVMGIERPPPTDGFSVRITTLGSVARIATDNFFSPTARRRLVVVFTDGETKPFTDESLGTVFRQPPGVHAIFVRIWGAHERVYDGRAADPLYRPDPMSATYIHQLAETSGGVALEAGDFNAIVQAARSAVGNGPTEVLKNEQRRLELAPFLAGFAFLPLSFLLWRRNL
ncbi:MAG: VWA domain-containing protein [Actinobacteria bacterium]|nr:MAG: VWA domain-containing protein [Actinomycetota bacterium]